jgi:hypothetical protein
MRGAAGKVKQLTKMLLFLPLSLALVTMRGAAAGKVKHLTEMLVEVL